uniref:Integrase catalytic domain-containing protein n=1 Tax=Quercus lobata TaxID=97700 RepID=A0A7N2MXE1_QUELO
MEKTIPRTPQQNGVAERMNKILNKHAKRSFVPMEFKIPEEVWSGKEKKGEEEKENVNLQVNQSTLVAEVHRSSRIIRPLQRYSPSLNYLLVTDAGEPKCYDKALQDENSIKWILRYLRGSTSTCLCFTSASLKLQGYVDADLAGDIDGRKSTNASVFTLGGIAISWVLNLQKIAALFTIEAEYVAATEAKKEMIWLHSFLDELESQVEDAQNFSPFLHLRVEESPQNSLQLGPLRVADSYYNVITSTLCALFVAPEFSGGHHKGGHDPKIL